MSLTHTYTRTEKYTADLLDTVGSVETVKWLIYYVLLAYPKEHNMFLDLHIWRIHILYLDDCNAQLQYDSFALIQRFVNFNSLFNLI